MQTSPSPQQTVKPREYELQSTIHQNISTPGMREMLEFARLKADTAHSNYLKSGPDAQQWAMEKAWREVMRVIEEGPKLDKLKQPGGTNG